MTQTTSLFFYSSYCRHCKNLIQKLNESPLSSLIKYVCIDSKSVRDKLPKYIVSVPTLVVGNTNQILVGKNISDWICLESTKHANVHHLHHKPQIPERPTQNTHAQKNQVQIANLEPGPWHNNEMNAFSDMYSFIDIDTSAQGNGGMSMIHNFETICETKPEDSVQTPPLPGASYPSMPVNYQNGQQNNFSEYGSIQTSEKSEKLNKQMEELLLSRESEVPNTPTRI